MRRRAEFAADTGKTDSETYFAVSQRAVSLTNTPNPCARGSDSPWENGYVESFNGKLRDELLNRELFLSLEETRSMIDRRRLDYSHHRIHSALNYQTPPLMRPAVFFRLWLDFRDGRRFRADNSQIAQRSSTKCSSRLLANTLGRFQNDLQRNERADLSLQVGVILHGPGFGREQCGQTNQNSHDGHENEQRFQAETELLGACRIHASIRHAVAQQHILVAEI